MNQAATKPVTTAALLALCLAAAPAPARGAGGGAQPDLSRRLEKEASRAGGVVAVHVDHLPSGRWAASSAARVQQPLYSVFKLTVAVTVLKEVEAGRLSIDRPVEVTARDVPASQAASNPRWSRLPATFPVKDLLDLSIVDSDNPATDKLIDLVGGPATVARTLKALALPDIDVKFRCREQSPGEGRLNRGSAEAMNRLLVRLHTGALLKAPQQTLLLDMMTRSQTGLRRLRGNLPPGTVVADKTGTGPDGSVTNDVGFITLPGGQRLAISVLISGSKLSLDEQSRLIASLARIAYDAFAGGASD